MNSQSFAQRIRLMLDEELDKELMSHEINDTGRMMILHEMSMRNSRSIANKVPWYVGLSVCISLIALGITIISNWTILSGWFYG